MKSRNIFLAITLILAVNQVSIVESAVYDIIRTLLQWNVAGIPLIHETREFEFDPEISKKRRQLFYELNGFRAAKYIERIGLGIDGRHHERLEEQKIRDEVADRKIHSNCINHINQQHLGRQNNRQPFASADLEIMTNSIDIDNDC